MAKGRKTGGRTKGTPNKITSSVKEKLTTAFASIGDDTAFAAWAKENPTEFYKLWAKMLPAEVEQTTLDVTHLSPEEREQRAASLIARAAERKHLKLA